MTELPSNDYISQINQNGSGLNIPQIVGAIVDSEIAPVRAPVVKQQEQVAASISGLSQLKQAAELTNKNIANFKTSDVSIATRSTDTDVLTVSVTDQSELKVGVSKITAITQLAQAHSHSIPAAGSARSVFTGAAATLPEDYNLEIRFGTYNLTAGAQSFRHDASTTTTNISFSQGESISAVSVKLDQIEGLNAKVVNTNGNDHKIMITGETGLDNAFQIKTLPITINASDMVNGAKYKISSPTSYTAAATTMVIGDWYQIVDTDSYAQDADDIINNREYKIVSKDSGVQDDAADMVAGRWYRIATTDGGQASRTTIQNNAWYKIVNTDNGTVTDDGNFVVGGTYKITTTGDTDFTAFSDAVDNAVGRTFKVNANAQGTGTGKAKAFTDYKTMFGASSNAPNTEFKANITNTPPPFGNGQIIPFTKFSEYYGSISGNEFKATANGTTVALTGPGRVIPFTNYVDEFNALNNNVGTIFGKNRSSGSSADNNNNGGANTGPGRVEAYTNFDLDYGGQSGGNNTAGHVFEATAAGTAATGSGTVRPYTNFDVDYGAANNVNDGNEFTASGGPFKGGGRVTLNTEDVFGTTDYRIFDTWKDHRNADGSQLRTQDLNAKDIIFDLNGLEVKRETNIVTDVVPGASFEILKTSTIGAEIITGADKETLKKTVQSFIDEVNAYRADLKALSRSDKTGGEIGELYGNPYVKSRLRALSEFMLKPIAGYTSLDKTANGGSSRTTAFTEANPVYLSQLGFKTQKDGTYGLDQNAFDTTFNNAPGNFDALTKDHAFSKHPEITVVWDGNEDNTPAGIYEFHHADDDNPFGADPSDSNVIYSRQIRGGYDQKLYRSARTPNVAGGVYTYSDATVNSTGDFPGLSLRTTRDNLGDDVPMNVHLGKSFATRFAEFHDDILNNTYIHRRQVQNVELQNEMLLERIARLDLRSNTLAHTYNEQFQRMEEMVTDFKSTGSYLTSVVDSWKNK